MIYIRKIFKQDLRDGKQIAFPKEPSLNFFHFDYLNNESDRKISFKFDSVGKEFAEFNGEKIETRLYAAGSESRIDGELKAFLRDTLKIGIDDFLIIKNNQKNNVEYDFFVVTKNNRTIYNNYLSLTNAENHTLVVTSEEKIDNEANDRSYNRIVFGAPGTGKTFIINNEAEKHFGTTIDITPKDIWQNISEEIQKSEEKVPLRLQDLYSVIRSSMVQIQKFNPEGRAEKEHYIENRYSIAVNSGYHMLGYLFAEIANFSYPTAISNLKLNRYSGIKAEVEKSETHGWTPITMSVTFNLTTYTSKKVGK